MHIQTHKYNNLKTLLVFCPHVCKYIIQLPGGHGGVRCPRPGAMEVTIMRVLGTKPSPSTTSPGTLTHSVPSLGPSTQSQWVEIY